MSLPRSDLEEILDVARPSFEGLRGARIFITGGTGFWGTWLLESLMYANDRLGLGVEATVLSRQDRLFPHGDQSRVRFIRGDIRSFPFPEGDYSHVLHCATSAGSPEDGLETADVIANGTRRVLEFARDRGVARLLLASSGAVYGRQPTELKLLSEDHAGAPDPLDPASAYGTAKRMAEQLCALHTAGTGPPCVVARGFAFVGPGLPLNAHFAIGNFIRDAVARQPVVIHGDGTAIRAYLYASDLTAWLWALLAGGRPGRAYNVGSEEAVSLLELAQLVAQTTGVETRVEGRAGVPSSRYVPSVRRAAEELGLAPRVGLREAISRTCAWVEAQTRETA